MSECLCIPCPVHDSVNEQGWRDQNAKRAAYERSVARGTEAPLDEIVLKRGTLVSFNGIPFQTRDDTVVLGRKENHALAMEIANEISESRQVHSPGAIGDTSHE